MSKKSLIERNLKRRKISARDAVKRALLKATARDLSLSQEERFTVRLKLAKMPRNGSQTRVRNRCELTGRPRGNYRKFGICRIALRDMALDGQIPGMVKSSW
jgi:small subunit ribosomal protein S14